MRSNVLRSKPGAFALGLSLLSALSSAPALAESHEITIENMKYSPANVAVKPGDSVVWINKDILPHTVTAEAGKDGKRAFDSGMIQGGQKFELKVAEAGELKYSCRYHPMMKGVLSSKK